MTMIDNNYNNPGEPMTMIDNNYNDPGKRITIITMILDSQLQWFTIMTMILDSQLQCCGKSMTILSLKLWRYTQLLCGDYHVIVTIVVATTLTLPLKVLYVSSWIFIVSCFWEYFGNNWPTTFANGITLLHMRSRDRGPYLPFLEISFFRNFLF